LPALRIEDAKIEPAVTLVANDNWLEFTIRYITDYKRRRTSKDILFTWIMEEFDASGGTVSLAYATFHLVDAPVFNVRLTEKWCNNPAMFQGTPRKKGMEKP